MKKCRMVKKTLMGLIFFPVAVDFWRKTAALKLVLGMSVV